MSLLPELNLNLGISNNQDFPFYDGGEKGVMIRADSGLRKHTVSLMISDKEAGEIIMKIGEKEVDLRISSFPTIFGEKFVLRILDKDSVSSK